MNSVSPINRGAWQRHSLPLLALLFAFALAFQGARGLFDPDEGRYAIVALRMLRTGDWLTPTLNHEVIHPTKPPLFYWSLASSMAIFGRNEWALRLPNALAFVAAAWLVRRMARHLAPGREDLATVIQATSLLPFVAANVVTTDTVLAAFETLGVAAFVEHWWGRRQDHAAAWLMWLAFGAAFLTKGPPALLPLLAIFAFTGWRGGRSSVGSLLRPGPVVGFTAVAFGWFAIEMSRLPGLVDYLVGKEVVGRMASPEFNRNAGLLHALKTYLPVLLLGAFPGVLTLFRRGKKPAEGARALEDDRLVFLLLWLLLPLMVFFAARSRLPLYLLPLAPAASLLLARRLPADLAARPRLRWALGAWALGLVALKAVSPLVETERDGRLLAREIRAVAPAPPQEVLWVAERPRYTIGVYLDAEIEWLHLGRVPPAYFLEPAYQPRFESLAQELEDPEHKPDGPDQLYLVRPADAEAFLAEARGHGVEPRRVGRVRKWEAYWL
ncbi:MAG TPA: glycosyltransferase family 39 protein [Thermoanaerobaculia bacterium]|nr:glycosyltransferase family 39 protein [Thermoanaerobaculia bacterium]